jgi:hypothetical protein
MEKKICSKCKIEKDVCCFSKDKYSKDGLTYSCKLCKKKRDKEYNEKKIISIDEKKKKLKYIKNWQEKNREKIVNDRKKKYEKDREKILLKNNIYRINNPLKTKERLKIYFEKNKDKRSIREYNRRNNNPLYRLEINIRSRVRQFLKQKGYTKKNLTFNIIGCSPQSLKEHIEKQFTEGMCWEKMGRLIHIDHIIPLSSAKTEEELYKLFHFTNLQPLWAEDNMKKGAKIIPQ